MLKIHNRPNYRTALNNYVGKKYTTEFGRAGLRYDQRLCTSAQADHKAVKSQHQKKCSQDGLIRDFEAEIRREIVRR